MKLSIFQSVLQGTCEVITEVTPMASSVKITAKFKARAINKKEQIEASYGNRIDRSNEQRNSRRLKR